MCAIAGIISPNNSARILHRDEILKCMAHRGPDGQSDWKNKSIHLFHSRLAILDLNERAAQPFHSQSKKTIVTFNGEIYNFKELKQQFSIPCKTTSDTEILTELFELKKEQTLNHLDGMFAFGAYTEKDDSLMLAVDISGKKPIYTFWDGTTFAFASEIKILEAMGLPLVRDEQTELEYLFFGYVRSPMTYYKNIRKLPAGHFQLIKSGQPLKPQRYFNLPSSQRNMTYQQAQEETQHFIVEAIKKRLISDRPLGCFLSGGLDSSIISLEASKLVQEPLKTFSISFKQSPFSKEFDESQYAQIVAQKINSEHTVFEMDNNFEPALKIINHFDEPYADSSCFPTAQLCKRTSQIVKVVLSGDGGDELYGGYLRFRASLMAERLKSFKSIIFLASQFPLMKNSFQKKLHRFHSALNENNLSRLALWNSFFSFDDIKTFSNQAEEKLREHINSWDRELSSLSLEEKILHFNFHHYLQNDLLPKVDRMSMLYGLEVRSPFLDKNLIKSAFSLPSKYKFSMFNTKIILKDIYRSQLSKAIVDRQKKGFGFHLDTVVHQQGLFKNISQPMVAAANTSSKKFALMSLNQFKEI